MQAKGKTLFARKLQSWLSPADAFILLFAEHPFAFWLDRENHHTSRFSVIGASVGQLPVTDNETLKALLESVKTENEIELPFEFRPGVVGVFSYERQDDIFMLCDSALVFDHDAKELWFIGVHPSEAQFTSWVSAALLRFALVGGQQSRYRTKHSTFETGKLEVRHVDADYIQLIERCREHIAAGDVYQICLTNEVSAPTKSDPLATFLRLRESNPAPYSSYLRCAERAVVSASPELFLHVDPSGLITTKPIKGTRRRSSDPVEDDAIARELQENQKERAENLMIVDLMRNDLGRVCEVGSVDVPKLFDVEHYSTVHQLVSTVVGQKLSDVATLEVIDSAFPGGSMTGAPKLRAIEILEQLEGGRRGIYSGVMGYLASNGSVDLGMVIRTLVFHSGTVSLGIGGGITIDSIAADELEETKLKARALLTAVGAPQAW